MPNLFIDIEARYAQFMDALDKVSTRVDKQSRLMTDALGGVNTAFATLGVGLSVAGLAAFTVRGVNAIAMLDDLSEKSTLSVETLSKLQEVTRIGGHDLNSVADVASKFAKNVSAANGGNKELIGYFKQMGISVDDLKSKSFDDLFVQFATTTSTAADKQNALAVAAKLSGKSIQELIPFFNDLTERGLGVAKVTTEQAQAAERAQKNFAELGRRSAEWKDGLINNLVPGIVRVTEEMRKATLAGDNLLLVMAKAAKATFFGDEQLRREVEFTQVVNRKLELEKSIGALETNDKRTKSQERRLEMEREALKVINARADAMLAERRVAEAAEKKPPAGPGITVGALTDPGAAAAAAARAKKLADDQAEEELRRRKLLGKHIIEQQEEVERNRAELAKYTTELQIAEAKEVADALTLQWKQVFESIDAEQERAIENGRILLEGHTSESKRATDAARELGLTFESAFEDAVIGGKKFSEVLKGIAADIARIILRKQVTEPLAKAVGGINWGSLASSVMGFFGFGGARAGGGPVSAGMSYLVGERGPELFTPGASGSIAPNSALAASRPIVNIYNNASGTEAKAQQNPDGTLSVFIERIEQAIGQRINNGQGLATTLEHQYGLARAAGSYR